MKQKLLLTLSCIAMSCMHASAQSVGPSALNAAGGSGTIGASTYEFSIGELTMPQTYSSATLVVTDGVLQPNIFSSGVSNPGIAAKELSVYPNPVQHVLFLQPAFSHGGKLRYVLTDAAGKTIYTQERSLSQGNERQEINMSAIAAGQYTLSVEWQQGGQKYNSAYKIQKLQ